MAVPENTYILYYNMVETVNQQVLIAKINDALQQLHVQRNNFLLLSNSASYMTASTVALKILYS